MEPKTAYIVPVKLPNKSPATTVNIDAGNRIMGLRIEIPIKINGALSPQEAINALSRSWSRYSEHLENRRKAKPEKIIHIKKKNFAVLKIALCSI